LDDKLLAATFQTFEEFRVVTVAGYSQ
jgi:hypothetical protein